MKGFYPNYGTVTHAPGTPQAILETLAAQVHERIRISGTKKVKIEKQSEIEEK
jgi:hypothetical protein